MERKHRQLTVAPYPLPNTSGPSLHPIEDLSSDESTDSGHNEAPSFRDTHLDSPRLGPSHYDDEFVAENFADEGEGVINRQHSDGVAAPSSDYDSSMNLSEPPSDPDKVDELIDVADTDVDFDFIRKLPPHAWDIADDASEPSVSDEEKIDDDNDNDLGAIDWDKFENDMDGLTAWDRLGEEWDREVASIGMSLTYCCNFFY